MTARQHHRPADVFGDPAGVIVRVGGTSTLLTAAQAEAMAHLLLRHSRLHQHTTRIVRTDQP